MTLKAVLLSIQLFSTLIVQVPLRAYQVEPANAVIDSCLHSKGLEFLLVFPRQSGKDETIAQLVTFLLTLFQRTEACVVHVYPTQQQITTGTTRLQRRLANMASAGRSWMRARPTRLGLGSAYCAFFSGHPQARAEGATANLLLIVNEVQDQSELIIERRFTPMRASTNATAIYVGTVRTTTDYLWTIKTRLERLQQADGIRRVYLVTPDQVGQANPHYRDFVEAQVLLKGRQHPTVKTELFCEPLDTAAGLFPPRRLALMRGTHARARTPEIGAVYVATLDVAGQDEATTEGLFSDLVNPARDYTVCTIFKATPGDIGPTFEAVDTFVDQGSRHFQPAPGQPPLFERLLGYLNHWQPIALVSDASGVGQGLTDALMKAWPRQVIAFDFAKGHNKAQLGNDLLAVVETGRFRYWQGDEDADWFFLQCERCAYDLAEGQPIERGLKWGVHPGATYTTPAGETAHVHDDRLLSAALIAEADRRARAGELFIGATQSAVITRKTKTEEWS